MLNTIVKMLENKGFESEVVIVTKNGNKVEGLAVGKSNYRPVFYVKKMLQEGLSPEKIVNQILKQMENPTSFDIEKITSWDYVKDNLQLCLQAKSKENILKHSFLDMEAYIRVNVSKEASYKIQKNCYPVSTDELFRMAFEQSKANSKIQSMSDVMSEFGISTSDEDNMLVLTNKEKIYGASTICDIELLKELSKRRNSNLVVLPSSIHECLVVFDDNPYMDMYNDMVASVNETEVSPEERLSNHAYFFDKETGKLS